MLRKINALENEFDWSSVILTQDSGVQRSSPPSDSILEPESEELGQAERGSYATAFGGQCFGRLVTVTDGWDSYALALLFTHLPRGRYYVSPSFGALNHEISGSIPPLGASPF